MLLYDGGNSGGFSSFKMIGDLLPISGFSSSSSWKMTGIPLDRNARRSSASPAGLKTSEKKLYKRTFEQTFHSNYHTELHFSGHSSAMQYTGYDAS